MDPTPSAAGRPDAPERFILVVDDDDLHRRVTAGILADAGLGTIEAGSGAEALQVVGRQRVDAVLIDQVMPGMSGIELTRALRVMPVHLITPLLFVSAEDSPSVRVDALRAGATDFMVKPVEGDELVARVQAQLGLAAQWESRMETLRTRAATISDIASMPPVNSPVATAREICRRIARTSGGRGVAILSWESEPVPLAATGSPAFLAQTPAVTLPGAARPGPWIHYAAADWPARRHWAACAPVRLGRAQVGVLVIEGGDVAQEEVLSSAVDYAAIAAIHLGPALTRTQRVSERRQAVHDALRPGAFEPVFQPVIDLRSAHVVGYEALTRLAGGQPILELLAEAEDARMRSDAEMVLLREAVKESARLPEGPWLSINLSPSVLTSHTAELVQVFASTRRQIVIELTENERIEDYAAVRRAVAELGDRVRVSVDDTGSGYASLRHVVDLRPHYLKLDRGWITGVEGDETRQALIAGMVGFCEHTATQLIAEGIERQPERETLEGLGVLYGQGYLLGRPEPAG